MQIESLWYFNAKYDPTWRPRFAVYDGPEHVLPSALLPLLAPSRSATYRSWAASFAPEATRNVDSVTASSNPWRSDKRTWPGSP